MATNQEGIIAALKAELTAQAVTHTGLTYEGLWHALWTQQSIAGTNFNERMLNWINGKLASSHTNLPVAMQAFAVGAGYYNWSSMGDIDVTAAI